MKSIKSIKGIKRIKNRLVSSALGTRGTFGSLRSGFTLIELLIYTGMLMVLLAVFTTIFGQIIDAQLESEATSSVQQDSQYILSKLAYDITRSQSVEQPATPGSSGNTLQLTINSVVYTYSLDGSGNLTIAANTGSDQLNSYKTTISGLQFTNRGNSGGKNSIQFNYTVTSKTLQGNRTETAVVSSSASLR